MKKNGIELLTDISFEMLNSLNSFGIKKQEVQSGFTNHFEKPRKPKEFIQTICAFFIARTKFKTLHFHTLANFGSHFPHEHHFAELVIRQFHENVMHKSTQEILKELRAKYWVTRARHTVKRLLSKCILCKKIQGKACVIPPEPPLPVLQI